MQGTSREFQEVVCSSHDGIAEVEIVRNDVLIGTLDCIDGSMDADRSARYLRRFEAKLTDPTGELTPGDIRDLLAPFGTEVRLRRGARVPVTVQERILADTSAQWNRGTFENTAVVDGDLIIR
jgi:hypothetical protein